MIVPESVNLFVRSIAPGSRVNNFALRGAELKPRRFTEAPVMAELGFLDFIIYGDFPRGGITSIIVEPMFVSRGCSPKSS